MTYKVLTQRIIDITMTENEAIILADRLATAISQLSRLSLDYQEEIRLFTEFREMIKKAVYE